VYSAVSSRISSIISDGIYWASRACHEIAHPPVDDNTYRYLWLWSTGDNDRRFQCWLWIIDTIKSSRTISRINVELSADVSETVSGLLRLVLMWWVLMVMAELPRLPQLTCMVFVSSLACKIGLIMMYNKCFVLGEEGVEVWRVRRCHDSQYFIRCVYTQNKLHSSDFVEKSGSSLGSHRNSYYLSLVLPYEVLWLPSFVLSRSCPGSMNCLKGITNHINHWPWRERQSLKRRTPSLIAWEEFIV
jgi:hypothetical protein